MVMGDKDDDTMVFNDKNQINYGEVDQSTNSMNLDLQKSELMMQSVIDMQKDPDFSLATGTKSQMIVWNKDDQSKEKLLSKETF